MLGFILPRPAACRGAGSRADGGGEGEGMGGGDEGRDQAACPTRALFCDQGGALS